MDELSGVATAGLHHPGCRPPGWNDGSLILTSSSEVLTWEACAFLLAGERDGRPGPLPALLVNPGLEQVTLKPDEGTWRLAYAVPFERLGLVPPGSQLMINRPVPGATAQLTATEVSVAIESWPRSYKARAPQQVLAAAQQLGGVLFMVTHALLPADLDERSLYELLQSGRVICGWVAISGQQ